MSVYTSNIYISPTQRSLGFRPRKQHPLHPLDRELPVRTVGEGPLTLSNDAPYTTALH